MTARIITDSQTSFVEVEYYLRGKYQGSEVFRSLAVAQDIRSARGIMVN